MEINLKSFNLQQSKILCNIPSENSMKKWVTFVLFFAKNTMFPNLQNYHKLIIKDEGTPLHNNIIPKYSLRVRKDWKSQVV